MLLLDCQRKRRSYVDYTSQVGHSIAGWLCKNKDPLNETVVGLLQSSLPLLAQPFKAEEAARGKKQNKKQLFLRDCFL